MSAGTGGMLKERTYGAVKRMILAGTLRPGEKLAERDLSRRLKVSRTPLREGCARQEFRRDGRCNASGFWYWSAPGTILTQHPTSWSDRPRTVSGPRVVDTRDRRPDSTL
jgi:hypothetical protein